MTLYQFGGSIAVRFCGVIEVEAESLDEAKALMLSPEFDMEAAFEPNGDGDDDFGFVSGHFDIFAEQILYEDENGVEVEIDHDDYIRDPGEIAREAGPELLDALQDLLEEAENTSAYEDALEGEDDAMLRAVEKAREAITKAGGVA